MKYYLRKLGFLLVTFWVIVTLTFVLMKAVPGDPFMQEQALPKEIHDALRKHYGLDDPWYEQYWNYLTQIATWNFGPSFIYKGQTVNEIINKSFPVSAVLGLEALFLAISFGITLGTFAAIYHHRWQDNTAMILAALGLSIPSFILASLLQYTLGFQLGWFPIARWGAFMQTVLPAVSLAAMPMAFIARMTRVSMLKVLHQDYIKTARAKGLTESRVLARHAFLNALLPLLGYLGQLSANILTGSFIIEKIFSIPGLGQWFVSSISNRDYTVIMGVTVFYSLILLGAMFLVDIIHSLLDPRAKEALA